MAQWIIALAFLSEDQRSSLSTHTVAHNPPNSISRRSGTIFWTPHHWGHVLYTFIHRCKTHKIKVNKSLKLFIYLFEGMHSMAWLWRSEDNLQELGLSFSMWVPGIKLRFFWALWQVSFLFFFNLLNHFASLQLLFKYYTSIFSPYILRTKLWPS